MSAEHEKARLLAGIAAARARLVQSSDDVRRSFDVPSRFQSSYKKHRGAWLGGAALLGLILSKLPSRKTTVYVERSSGQPLGATGKLGLVWSAVKLFGGLARPLLTNVAGSRLAELASRFLQPPADSNVRDKTSD